MQLAPEQQRVLDAANKAAEVADEHVNDVILDESSTEEQIEEAERAAEIAHQEVLELLEDARSYHEPDY